MLINVLSNDYRYKGVVALLAGGVTAAAAGWLRSLPSRAPMVRYARVGLLCAAAGNAIVAAVGPRTWVVPTTIAASLLVVTAVLVVAGVRESTRTLFGAALAGGGIVALQHGATLLGSGNWLSASQLLIAGPVGIAGCLATVRDSMRLRLVVLGAMRVICALLAAAFLLVGQPLEGLSTAFAGLTAHYFYVRAPKQGTPLREVAPGVSVAIGSSIRSPSRLRRFIDRRAVSAAVFGLAVLVIAALALVSGERLFAAAFTAGGIACFGRCVQLLPYGRLWPAARGKLRALLVDPQQSMSSTWKSSEEADPVPSDGVATATVGDGSKPRSSNRSRPSNVKRRKKGRH
ncbi:hypothetical protein [Dactylosporangium sp. CA-233914]|uniref:hypothetical protein n=1 Tax=Dactylosporangium sp. CA-233914 TaxID=3239934 RepID=UPI003D8A72BD